APRVVGVRTHRWCPREKRGGGGGVYAPGAFFSPRGVQNAWPVSNPRLQNIEMTHDPRRGDKPFRDDLLFKTIDGNDISLDVIVSYRIDAQKAPHVLQFVGTNDYEVKDKVVRTITRSRPRDIFGELKTEDFYVSDTRDAKSDHVKKVLNEMLNPYGVIVERVSTKDYRFNAAYQKAIEDRKVADQVAEQNKSATKAAQEEYLKKLEDAKGDV